MTDITLTYNNKDYNLDGLEDINLKISKKASTVGNPKSIKTPVTRTLGIPKTPNNIKTMLFLGNVGSPNDFAYNHVDAKVIKKGINMFSKAKMYAKNATKKYSCVFKEGAGQFFDEIEGLSIKDLDFSDLEEIWNLTNIIAANTNTSGLIYPIIDYGIGSTHPDYIAAQELLPAVFAHTIFERIFDNTYNTALSKNYSLESEITTNTDYLAEVVPVVEENITADILMNLEASATTLSFYNLAHPGTNEDTMSFDNAATGPDVYDLIRDTNVPVGSGMGNRYVYNVPADGVYSFSSYMTYTNSAASFTMAMVNGSTTLDSINVTTPGYNSATLIATDVNCKKDDTIIITLIVLGGSVSVNPYADFECTNANVENITLDLPYPIASNLPDISQIDFVKEIMSYFALRPGYNVKTNTVIFHEFSYITDKIRTGDIQDYSGKIDFTKHLTANDIPNNYSFISLGKTNKMKWTNDDKGNVPANSGESSFSLNGINYIGEKDFVKSLFSSSKIDFIFSQLTVEVPVIPVFELDENDERKRVNEFKARIFALNRTATSLDYSDDDGSTTTTETTNIPLVNILDWEDFKTNYYTEYISAINQPDTPAIDIVFSVKDFVQFDNFKPLFFSELKGYYYCYDLSFLPDNISNMKLLKLK